MTDLIGQLRAALAEAELLADGALNPDPDARGSYLVDEYLTAEREAFEKRFTPDVVKALVAAHREILELHTPRTHEVRAFVPVGQRKDPAVPYEPTGAVEYTACPTCGGRDWDLERFATWEPCDTLRVLAKGHGVEEGKADV